LDSESKDEAHEDRATIVRKKLLAAAQATRIAEQMIAGRLPSPEEWAQLVSKALGGNEVPVDVAMRMQLELCDKWGMTVTEAETALHMACGEVDLGAPLCAEVCLHLYRQAGLCKTAVDIGDCWLPSQFDARELFEEIEVAAAKAAAAISGEEHDSVAISDILKPSVTLGDLQIVKHAAREWRTMQGHVEQNLESILDSAEMCLPQEFRKVEYTSHY